MMLTRVARTAAAVLEHTFTVGETGTNSTTPVTVTITDANGDVVDTGTATADPGVDGRYTFALEPQAALADLTVAWAGTVDGAAVVETDRVEIVGGFFFTLTALRNSDSSLESTDKYPTADLVRVRLEVEQECEEICDQSFVRRYRREVLNGTGSTDLVLPDAGVRTIRSVRVSPRVGLPFVGFTEAQLAALVVTDDRVLRRVDDNVWLPGLANVVVEYEHHGRELPVDLQRAALTRARTRLNIARSGIPDRAESFTAVDGGTYRLSLPSAYRTGIPEVDAVYARYSLRVGQDEDGAAGSGSRPASRMLSHDPQYYSLFHGGAPVTHTRAVAVKTALYQRLSAAPELAGVDVAYSWDGSDVERERIYLGRITSTSTLAIFGGSPRIKRDEQLSVTLYIVVRIPGGTVAETDARADELAAAVEELLTVDPGLSGVQGLSYATVAGHELEYLLDDDGCTSVLAYRITCSSRLR